MLKKEAGQCYQHHPAGAVPRVLSFPSRKAQVFAPEEWRVPQGRTHLVVKMTDNERHQNAGQHIGGHVQQELHHRHHLLSEDGPKEKLRYSSLAFKAACPRSVHRLKIPGLLFRYSA